MKALFIEVHEAWLATLFTGFMSKTQNKQKLYDFSDILFRHFTWLENDMVKQNIAYDYNRKQVPIKVATLDVMLHDIQKRLTAILELLDSCNDKAITHRMKSDLNYIVSVLKTLPNEEVTSAFDAKRKYPNVTLNEEACNALTLFLFEESYKEYELIMVYNYSKANSNDAFLNRIFQILIDESIFHLKSFGQMMSEMGILATPRVLMEEIYKFDDLEQFLKDGIQEEIGAKEACKKLSEAVSANSAEFASFFDFINNQENYHIALMEEALAHLNQ